MRTVSILVFSMMCFAPPALSEQRGLAEGEQALLDLLQSASPVVHDALQEYLNEIPLNGDWGLCKQSVSTPQKWELVAVFTGSSDKKDCVDARVALGKSSSGSTAYQCIPLQQDGRIEDSKVQPRDIRKFPDEDEAGRRQQTTTLPTKPAKVSQQTTTSGSETVAVSGAASVENQVGAQQSWAESAKRLEKLIDADDVEITSGEIRFNRTRCKRRSYGLFHRQSCRAGKSYEETVTVAFAGLHITKLDHRMRFMGRRDSGGISQQAIVVEVGAKEIKEIYVAILGGKSELEEAEAILRELAAPDRGNHE